MSGKIRPMHILSRNSPYEKMIKASANRGKKRPVIGKVKRPKIEIED